MIRCKVVARHHTAAREGALTGAARIAYRVHLTICPFCRAYAAGLDQAVQALDSLPVAPAPADLKEAALARLRGREKSSSNE